MNNENNNANTTVPFNFGIAKTGESIEQQVKTQTEPKPPSPSIVFESDPLGDGISACELISYSGSDDFVVKAARISTDRTGIETGKEKLIAYLINNRHETPLEHTQLTFRIKAPIFVMRQWHKHRIGWSYNELSRRYTSEGIEFYVPKPAEWRQQHAKNRQASSSESISEQAGEALTRALSAFSKSALSLYNNALSFGASREQARLFLPQNAYTHLYATCNLRSLMHFCGLRDKPDAQKEIAVYARAMAQAAEQIFPICWGAYKARSGD